MTLTLAKARSLFRAGGTVTVVMGAESSADWRYATVRSNGVECTAPGGNQYQYVTLDVLAGDVALRDTLCILMGGTAPKGTRYFLPVCCQRCGKPLTTPRAIVDGFGTDCGPLADARRARMEAKRAAMLAFTTNAARLAGGR